MSELVVGVQGASGRAGGLVVQEIKDSPDLRLGAAFVAAECKTVGAVCLGAAANKGNEVRYTAPNREDLRKISVFVDFSAPAASLSLAELCSESGIPLVIATTGFNAAELERIKKYSESAPILLAPNMSVGVFAMREISLLAQKILGPDFEVEIFEMHHNQKKDAPSGTAIGVGKALSMQGNLHARLRGEGPRHKGELGYASLRGGDVVGDHTVYFLGKGERLEVTHRATDRAIFARGALRAARQLTGRAAGLYEMSDIYK